jgi:hypothetical protein
VIGIIVASRSGPCLTISYPVEFLLIWRKTVVGGEGNPSGYDQSTEGEYVGRVLGQKLRTVPESYASGTSIQEK